MTLTKREQKLLNEYDGVTYPAPNYHKDDGDLIDLSKKGLIFESRHPSANGAIYVAWHLTPAGRAALEEHNAGLQMKEGGRWQSGSNENTFIQKTGSALLQP